ncbi:DUF3418 domain-containing protein, partial [Brevibacterium samyangense]
WVKPLDSAGQTRRGATTWEGRGASAGPRFTERTGLTTWDFDLDRTPVPTGGDTEVYPGLRDTGTAVDLTAYDDAGSAARGTRAGLVRLLALALADRIAYVGEHLSNTEKLVLAGFAKGRPPLLPSIGRAAVDSLVTDAQADAVRTAADFSALRDTVDARIIEATTAEAALVVGILQKSTELEKAVTKASSLVILQNLADVKAWHAELLAPRAIDVLPHAVLRRFPVYLDAALHRVKRMQENPSRDKQMMDRVGAVHAQVDRAVLARFPQVADLDTVGRLAVLPAPWAEVLWDVQELRVGLFAEHLKTRRPVSEQRVSKALAALTKG